MILAHEVTGPGPTATGAGPAGGRPRAGPALLLVHAGIADRRMWDGQVGPFADAGWTVIRPDLPGFAETPLPDGPVATWATLAGLLDHLSVERVRVVGCSLGGRAAVNLALAAPERVRALVLVGASLAGHRFAEPALHELWERSETAIERGDHAEAARVEVDTWVVGVGDHDRPDIQAMADALATGIPGARLAVIAGTGHLPNLERPAEFNRLVLEFLAEVAGRPG